MSEGMWVVDLRLREGQGPTLGHRTCWGQRRVPESCLQTLEKGKRHQRGRDDRTELKIMGGGEQGGVQPLGWARGLGSLAVPLG